MIEDRRGTVSVFNGPAPTIETFDDTNVSAIRNSILRPRFLVPSEVDADPAGLDDPQRALRRARPQHREKLMRPLDHPRGEAAVIYARAKDPNDLRVLDHRSILVTIKSTKGLMHQFVKEGCQISIGSPISLPA